MSSNARHLPLARRWFAARDRDSERFPRLQENVDFDDDPESSFRKHLWKYVAFVVLASGTIFAITAVQEQERRAKGITWASIMRRYAKSIADYRILASQAPADAWERFKRMLGLDAPFSPGQMTVATIIAFQAFITLCFAVSRPRSAASAATALVPSLSSRVMSELWVHYPPNRRFSTYITSMFSHESGVHLAMNSYVLYSFAPFMIDRMLGNEQFWAFYLSAGMMGALASTLSQAVRNQYHPSLGASGAIMV